MALQIQSDADARDPDADDHDDQTLREWVWNPQDLGGVFVRASIGFGVATFASLLGLAVQLFLVTDGPHLENPLLGWTLIVSHTAAAISVLGYAIWSMWKQRQLSPRSESNLFQALRRVHHSQPAHPNLETDIDLDAYETRVKKTVWALFIWVIVAPIPVRIIVGVLLSL